MIWLLGVRDLRFGVDLRTLNSTKVDLFDTDTSADYHQVTLQFGYDY